MADAPERMNESPTRTESGAELTQPRSLSDLRSFLHGYRIKAPGDKPRSARASTIIEGIDNLLSGVPADQAYHITLNMQRAARELAEIDPALSWLPDWKPRVGVAALAKEDGR